MITPAGTEHDCEAGRGGIDPFGGGPARRGSVPPFAPPSTPVGAARSRGAPVGAARFRGATVGAAVQARPELPTQRLPRVSRTPPARGTTRTVTVVLGLLLLAGAGVVAVLPRPGGPGGAGTDAQGRAESIGYDVPAGWTRTPRPTGTTAGGITLEEVASAGGYACNGQRRARASAGHTFVVRGDGGEARTEDAARDLARMFAASFYGEAASVAAAAAVPITVDGVTGTSLSVTVTARDGAGGCGTPAGSLTGGVTVVALPTDRRGRSGAPGVLLAVLQHDVSGGPATPAVVDERTVAGIVAGLRVVGPPERR